MFKRLHFTALVERLLPEPIYARLQPVLVRIERMLGSDDAQASAKRSSLIAFSIRVFSAALALISQVIMARLMGAYEFGIYVVVWISVISLGDFACFGFHTTIIRYVPQYLQNGERAENRGILRIGVILALCSATVIALIGIGILQAFAAQFESYYLLPFMVGFLCIPVVALGNILDGSARAHGWILAALSPAYIIRPLMMLVIMIGMIMAGYSASATTALIAALLGTTLTVIAQQIFLRNRIRQLLPSGPRTYHMREWLSVSLPIFFIEGFFFMLINIDVLMVGRLMEPDDVALYYATTKVLALAHFVYFAVKSSVAQRYSQLLHSGDKAEFASFARNSAQWTFWPTLLLAGIILLLGWPLLALFGKEFTQGYPLLFILIFGVIARASVGPCESLLSMSGNQNICAIFYAVALGLNIGLNLLLIPVLGLYGAAIATVCAMIFEAATLSFAVYLRLGIPMFIFSRLKIAASQS